jgi:serine/threonine protein kinase
MPSAVALGDCKSLIEDLVRCKLLKPSGLKKAQAYFTGNPGLSAWDLTEYLVSQELLSRAQAEEFFAVYEGRLTIGGYTLLKPLGRGSMGLVYRASSEHDDSSYAVKLLPRRNVGNVSRASQRLRTFMEFRHPSVPQLVRVVTAGDRHCLIWPYVSDAHSLDALVKKSGPLPLKLVVHYALQIANALHAAHSKNLFHGLIKPSNVLVDKEHRVHVADFGIGYLMTVARSESILNTLTNATQVASSLDCACPESILEPTTRTAKGDQYSLGCTLYYCLTGQYPFPIDNTVKKMMAHQFEEPKPIAELRSEAPPRLAEVVERLMKKNPDDRYEDLGECAEELQMLVAKPTNGKPVNGKAPNGLPTMVKRPRIAAAAPTGRNGASRPATLADIGPEDDTAPATRKDEVSGSAMIVWLVVGVTVGIFGTLVIWSYLR